MKLAEDIPAAIPQFGTSRLAEALANILAADRDASFVLGLHGPWGSGKTTAMNAIERQLKALDATAIIVGFNAWKYHDREALWRALILRVLDALREEAKTTGREKTVKPKIAELERSLYASFTEKERGPLQVNWAGLATEAILTTIRLTAGGWASGLLKSAGETLRGFFGTKDKEGKPDEVAKSVERVAGILQREVTDRAVEQVRSIEQFLKNYASVVGQLCTDGRKLYVLVDDLDRCLPEDALTIFEAIKLFLDTPQSRYVVALDRAVIRRGLALRYDKSPQAVDPDEYIEKTISLSFDLPVLQPSDGETILRQAGLERDADKAWRELILACLGTNPRRLKRFANSLTVIRELAQTSDEPPGENERSLLLKLSLIAYRNGALFELFCRNPARAVTLQGKVNQNSGDPEKLRSALAQEPSPIKELADDAGIWQILQLAPDLSEEKLVRKAVSWFRPAPDREHSEAAC